ncbi:MAG: hypothetical protein JWN61_3245 [Pseudonocardiales bacterium]|nr:hypothetical protein [Pseudonocardiales bacterium]
MSYDTMLQPLDLDFDLRELERRVALRPRERIVRRASQLRQWVAAHAASLAILSVLLPVAGIVHAWGMYGSPSRFDDEGTYTAYAWAVQYKQELGHYTYWYAHPPLGWIQMAAWNWITDAFGRAPYAIAAERQFMLVCKLVSVALMYGLALRLRMTRAAAVGACAMFALSPLVVYFNRMALLDNIVTPWLLASFFLAASPRRSLSAASGSGACFAVAVLTKETALLFLPALIVLFWQSADPRNRRFTVTMFAAVVVLLGTLFPLYALIKNELLEGPGHVSLAWAIKWQLFDRQGSGSIFDQSSTAYNVVHGWLALDHILPRVALVALPIGLCFRRTRAVAMAFGIQVASLLRSGYLPYPFIIAMIPFAALTLSGVLDGAWQFGRVHLPERFSAGRASGLTRDRPATRSVLPASSLLQRMSRVDGEGPTTFAHRGWALARRRGAWGASALTRAGVIICVIGLCAAVYSPWRAGLNDVMHRNRDGGKAQALAWVQQHVSKDRTVVVDDSLWVDLVRSGFSPSHVIWFTKLDVDKDVKLPADNPWTGIDYIVIDHQDELALHLNLDGKPSEATLALFPTMGQALLRSAVAASFGTAGDTITVRRVDPRTIPRSLRPS